MDATSKWSRCAAASACVTHLAISLWNRLVYLNNTWSFPPSISSSSSSLPFFLLPLFSTQFIDLSILLLLLFSVAAWFVPRLAQDSATLDIHFRFLFFSFAFLPPPLLLLFSSPFWRVAKWIYSWNRVSIRASFSSAGGQRHTHTHSHTRREKDI